MTIGDKIRMLRKKLGLSQEKLAKKLQINTRNISLYESGKTVPSADTIHKLASIFGVTTDFLLKDEPEDYANLRIKDKSLISIYNEIDQMDEREKEAIKVIVEALAYKRKIKQIEDK